MSNERKGKHIDFFKKGAIIVRLQPAIKEIETGEFNNITMEKITIEHKFFDYRGEPLEYVGVHNNMIICKYCLGYFKGDVIEFDAYNGWAEGWGLYDDYSNKLKSL